jgi:hypothetical protein
MGFEAKIQEDFEIQMGTLQARYRYNLYDMASCSKIGQWSLLSATEIPYNNGKSMELRWLYVREKPIQYWIGTVVYERDFEGGFYIEEGPTVSIADPEFVASAAEQLRYLMKNISDRCWLDLGIDPRHPERGVAKASLLEKFTKRGNR